MQVFEFHFNPKEKKDLIFDSFCSVPENIYEKRMGGLFMVGELKNPLPHNYHLLEKTASAIKKEFYSKFQRNHEQALKESLKRGNELLSAEVQKENTDWLGNLNFAIISLKNFDLNFTKVGPIKMFLLRGPHVIDIGSKLDSQEIEPYPLKIFNNIVSGKLGENDILLIFTEEIFPILKNTINEVAKIFPFDEKKLKDLIRTKEKELASFSGSFIVINVLKDQACQKRPKIVFEKEKEKFQIGQTFLPVLKYSKKAKSFFSSFASGLRHKPAKAKTEEIISENPVPSGPIRLKVKIQEKKAKSPTPAFRLKLPVFKLPVFKMPVLKLPVFKFKISTFKIKMLNKKFVQILLFIIILAVGFLIFQSQERQKQKEYLTNLQVIQEKVSQAENLMILQKTNPEAKGQALSLLSNAWEQIILMTKLDGAIKTKALSLKEKIDNDLKNLNNLTKIDEPELVFEFSKKVFIPQKIISDEKNLYLFSPYVFNIFSIDQVKKGQFIEENQKFNEATALLDGSVLFFSKPDTITSLKDGKVEAKFSLKSYYSDFNFTDLTSFKENVYFLDAASGDITRYTVPLADGKDNPEKWFFSRNAQKPVDGKSIAVDGSVWILDKNNNLLRYYAGYLQETVTPDVFPAPKSFSKIIIPYGSAYIFILEPTQKRVVILDKAGKIFRQYESERFDSLLDFTVSQNGQTIWLLNGQKIYKINL
jgi:hypothetical protein